MSVQIHVPTNNEIEQMSVDELRRASWNLMSQFQLVRGALATVEFELAKEIGNLEQIRSVVADTLNISA